MYRQMTHDLLLPTLLKSQDLRAGGILPDPEHLAREKEDIRESKYYKGY